VIGELPSERGEGSVWCGGGYGGVGVGAGICGRLVVQAAAAGC